jgi:hypothetical protein
MSGDAQRPWLGLASFTEESRAFFFGREEEVAELERRVQRKLLTVLFGKSGLGKTSILQAGLVPGLRDRGYFPVYIRIDYGPESPEPSEQIKQAINRAAAVGQWTQTEVAVPGESIWEYLHHRDDVLRDASGQRLIPLLIFDQFEELFTLAQGDESGRTRATHFIEELADLVENRAPKALEAKLEADESTAERFDFSRSDYRVVIALREDYLAPLESLKKQMPSLSQNRLRIAPMTGAQALQAVLQPGKHLVSEEVAQAIVRFVAGGSELANAEVEPSLLSLICRELNEQRIAQQRTEISLDLLAGSHESILSTFYERALADQPVSVRRLIEDELLTESGYRENLAEERVLRRLTAAGAAPDALGTLVDRRLLRIEERLDVRRVELTHDVLTGVVKASRAQRLEHEARAATERLLAEQHAREQAARRNLRRARTIALGCTVLAAVAVVAAGLAIVNVQRARRAEADARQTRATSEQARGQAEALLGYLTDDFVRELSAFGRFQTVAELSRQEIDYFHALPQALKDPQTVRNGALALVNHSGTEAGLQQTAIAEKDAAEAIARLEQQRRDGDRSEATTIVLASAYTAQGLVEYNQGGPNGDKDIRHAADLLRPIVARANSPVEAARAYIDTLYHIAFVENLLGKNEDSAKDAGEAMRLCARFGAGRKQDVTVDSAYVAVGGTFIAALAGLGRNEDARHASAEVLRVAGEVLAQRPQDPGALMGKLQAEGSLAFVASTETDPAEEARWATLEQRDADALVKLEPQNFIYLTQLNGAYIDLSTALWATGRLRDSIDALKEAMRIGGRSLRGGAFIAGSVPSDMAAVVAQQAEIGDAAGAASTVADADALVSPGKLREAGLGGQYIEVYVDALRAYSEAYLAYVHEDGAAARHILSDAVVKLQGRTATGGLQAVMHDSVLSGLLDLRARVEFNLGDFAAAAQDERASIGTGATVSSEAAGGNRGMAQSLILLSMALAEQGQRAEAAKLITPIVPLYRRLSARNHGDQLLPVEFAAALYAQALVDERARPNLIHEAAQQIARLPPNIAALHNTRQWRARIERAAAPLGQSSQ